LTIASAILASPYFVIKPGTVIADVYQSLFLGGKNGFDGWLIDPSGGYVFYLKTLGWGLGVGLALLALIGLVAALIRHQPTDLILAAFSIVWFLVLGSQKMYFARFILPVIPFLLILGAVWLDSAISRMIKKPVYQSLALVLVSVLLSATTLLSSIRSDYLLTQTDTRTLAKQWIEANLPEGARIALDWDYHSVPLSTQEKLYPDSTRLYQAIYIDRKGLSSKDLDWYRLHGYQYLIRSSNISRLKLADDKLDQFRNAFYDSLDHELSKVAEFHPSDQTTNQAFIFDELYGPAVSLWDRERPGPSIIIYRLDTQ
jgi:hypothetical protein